MFVVVFAAILVPETKGKSLTELCSLFKKDELPAVTFAAILVPETKGKSLTDTLPKHGATNNGFDST